MPTLSKELRTQLSKVTLAARTRAESAAQAALENLAVQEREPRGHMTVEQRKLRNRLRARGRALGDTRDERSGLQSLQRLAEATAYEHWHRLLFTRFLTENNLLMMPDDSGGAPVPVSIDECEELAPEFGARDGFDLACRFAGRTLPGVFRSDEPVLQLTFALNDQVELRNRLASLPKDVFTASDALGWTYQFWQADQKELVNKSGNKIGADELPSVTQLFTEDYMVDFLLDNTLGAWWAGKKVISNQLSVISCPTEEDARKACALPGCPWKYLRFVKASSTTDHCSLTTDYWIPAAGTFDGWPKSAAALRALDPCMGSGHFVVAMFERLVALRLAEEKLEEAAAVAAVIRDNLFGLEIDPRCTQIGAFNLALAAWRRVGHCKLPAMNLACSGLAPNAKLEDWLKIADIQPSTPNPQPSPNSQHSTRLRSGMERLYELFKQAPVWGSLINPRAGEGDLLVAAFHELQPLLEKALKVEQPSRLLRQESNRDDCTTLEMAVTARGLAKAAEILAGQFTLVATNVPYLGRGKQDKVLLEYCERVHPEASADLATCFVERCYDFAGGGGSTALVTPQSWLFLAAYKKLRKRLLKDAEWNAVARLGARAFETIGGEVVNVSLLVHTRQISKPKQTFIGLDVAEDSSPLAKATSLHTGEASLTSQLQQLSNPDWIIQLGVDTGLSRVKEFAFVRGGITSSDSPLFRRYFWEIDARDKRWAVQQGTVLKTNDYSGRELVLFWEDGLGVLNARAGGNGATIAGRDAWGRLGIAISKMSDLQVTLYSGEIFENVAFVLVPRSPADLPALWSFCSSPSFKQAVRQVNQGLCVDPGYYEKVPFDLAHWQKVAEEKYPHGLPKPFSSDPTQWLFNGHPKVEQPSRLLHQPVRATGTVAPLSLHVAVARLLGYQWPRQTGSSFPDCPALSPDGLESFADDDGIVCLPPLNREQPAAARLRTLLATALKSGATVPVAFPESSNREGSSTIDQSLRDTVYFNPLDPIEITDRDLPHWRQPGVTFFVTFRLADALPAEKLALIRTERDQWLRTHGEPWSEAHETEYFRLFSERVQGWLDAGRGSCLLRDARVADIVAGGLRHFDGDRYDLGAWVVMPNHVHAIVAPRAGWTLDQVLHSWKSFTAHAINRALNRTGELWQHEGYDHIVRNPGSLWRIEQYIADNPAKAGITTPCVHSRVIAPQSGATVPVANLPESNLPESNRDGGSTFDERGLLAKAGPKGSKSANLEDWLRDEFFEQHCSLFHDRPFIWHIWDGLKDGFHALVHYHRLDHGLLQKLTYTYVGDWIRQQSEDAKADKPGAATRLGAAQALQKQLAQILEGEAPYDLFTRWKALACQPIGWKPDLNDGVRLNLRPFLQAQDVDKKGAGLLRSKPGVKWDKDRGKEPVRDKADYPWFWCADEPGTDPVGGKEFTGNRWNAVHFTLARKRASH